MFCPHCTVHCKSTRALKVHLQRSFRCQHFQSDDATGDFGGSTSVVQDEINIVSEPNNIECNNEIHSPVQSEGASELSEDAALQARESQKILFLTFSKCNSGMGLSSDDVRRILHMLHNPAFIPSHIPWNSKQQMEDFGLQMSVGSHVAPQVGLVTLPGKEPIQFLYFDAVQVCTV